MHTENFFKSSQDIVKRFLSNVVTIDDELSFNIAKDQHANTQPQEKEDNFDSTEEDSLLGSQIQTPSAEEVRKNQDENRHVLDYQDLSLAFAEYGINCSGFIPDTSRFNSVGQAASKIMESARRADITILDWRMDRNFNANPGDLAKTSITKILENDKQQLGRLRLIVIYTAESDLQNIAEDITNHLATQGIEAKTKDKNIEFETPELEFCKISVIEKKPTSNELRDEVIKLFTELTNGLLSSATLSAISELRDNTHHILHSFNKHLDPAYMSHVFGLLSSPQVREKAHEVAFDYATDLISEELKSSLQISENIKENLNIQRLKDWVDYACISSGNPIEIKINSTAIKSTPERLKRLLEVTNEEQLEAVLRENPPIANSAKKFSDAKIEIILQNTARNPHESLSAIECKRRDIFSIKEGSPEPSIKLGSIVERNGEYFICMQPLCDTVRIKENRNFIFLKIDRVGADKKFTHVIKTKNDFVRLNIKPDSKNLHTFSFTPDPNTNTIKTQKENDRFTVMQNNQTCPLTWVGELKNNIAQSIVNLLSAQISRVGIDKNEWLRMSEK